MGNHTRILIAVLSLAALAACGSYRDFSPKSDRNLALDTARPEWEDERLYLIGDLLKVINFEGTDKGSHVYVPMTIRALVDPAAALTQIAYRISRKKSDLIGWNELTEPYVLTDNHRHIKELEKISLRESWENHYKDIWNSQSKNPQTAGSDSLEIIADLVQVRDGPRNVGDDTSEAIGLMLITEKGFFEVNSEYQFDFTPTYQRPDGTLLVGKTVSYTCIVDRNNAILGFGLGLLIVGIVLGVS